MKKLLSLLLMMLLAIGLVACTSSPDETDVPEEPVDVVDESEQPATPANPVIRISTTTSVNDSGLLPYLQPTFEAATGYSLEITSGGTGAAIEKGKTGDADLLLVHSKSQEEDFITEGFATERIPFMHNYFVIVGPADDPAGVANAASASEAFAAIAASGQTFISRGDNSGTHTAENKIWEAAGIEPDPASGWYISAGAGMGDCLNMAAEEQAYVLSDKATYLAHAAREQLAILLEESAEMKNTYSLLAVSIDKWADVNAEGAQAFIDWMLSDEASALIAAYGVEQYGEQLFFLGE